MTKCDFNFIEIALRHGCSPVNVLHIFRTPFQQNTSEWLLLLLTFSDCMLRQKRQLYCIDDIGIFLHQQLRIFRQQCQVLHLLAKKTFHYI